MPTYTVYDDDDDYLWNTITGYIEDGDIDWVRVDCDDGSYSYKEFDDGDSFPWSLTHDRYDSDGNFNWQIVDNDDGSSSVYDVDQNDDKDWSSQTAQYDANGELTHAEVEFDDGSSWTYSSAAGWSADALLA